MMLDFMAVATDDVQRRYGAEVLVPGIPVRSHVSGTNSEHMQYQVFINNPSTRMRIRASCMGTKTSEACKSILLSGDTRTPFPGHFGARAYAGTGANGVLEFTVDPAVSGEREGYCKVPCVLNVRVEALPSLPGHRIAPVTVMLMALQGSDYELLLDGNDPVKANALTSRPKYFLFDSRRSSPLLTIVAKIPYDSSDPYGELVSMYVLDCEGNMKDKFRNVKHRPSREHHDFRGHFNSNNQMVTFITHPETSNCHYRIAVISHRNHPQTFSIRGYDWHQDASLPMGEPLHGLVDAKHRFSYVVEPPRSTFARSPDVVISLEVCFGDLQLKTAGRAPKLPREYSFHAGDTNKFVDNKPTSQAQGGIDELKLPLAKARWMELSASGSGEYILTADDPRDHVWLQPKKSEVSVFEEQESSGGKAGSVVVQWEAALLFGKGQPPAGTGGDAQPAAEYEVFYWKEPTELDLNVSTPCGLYEAHKRRKAKRQSVKTARQVVLKDLSPDANYVFNVVARNLRTGRSVAYTPSKSFALGADFVYRGAGKPQAATTEGRSSFWDDVAPIGIIALVLCCCWSCRRNGGENLQAVLEGIELPSFRSNSGRGNARSYVPVSSASAVGSYQAPSLMGTGR